jgi:hypothetical protein
MIQIHWIIFLDVLSCAVLSSEKVEEMVWKWANKIGTRRQALRLAPALSAKALWRQPYEDNRNVQITSSRRHLIYKI